MRKRPRAGLAGAYLRHNTIKLIAHPRLLSTSVPAMGGDGELRMRWILGIAGVLVALALIGCSTVLPKVRLDPDLAPPAPPNVLGALVDDPAIASATDWETRRAPLLRQAFADHIYGPYPPNAAPPRLLLRETITYNELPSAILEQWSVGVGDPDHPLHFNMMVVLPRHASGPVPIVVMQNFCGNRPAFVDAPPEITPPLTPVFSGCESAWAQPLVKMILGRHINGPPFEDVLARGYGVALFYAGDVVADEPVEARAGLVQLYGDQAERTGAIAAWAWLYSQAYDVLAADPRIDAERVAIWGHSRNGKAALLAAAMDPRIAAVIAHQSGRGGASLSRSSRGESIGEMMENYPHWFPQSIAHTPTAGSMLDQHDLIALVAPRPVFLGNASRDAWADPLGAWAAAEAATPAYRLYGVDGLNQNDMRTPNPSARIWYYTRGGLHGVTSADWDAFLEFMDAMIGG